MEKSLFRLRAFRASIKLLFILLTTLSITACATAPYTGRTQFIIMSESEEMQLGMRASQEILKKENIETGTARSRLVLEVGRKIEAVAERPQFEWEFHTINKDELNAFCLPGGKVFVYTGLLKLIDNNPDELAAVMGHEIAHAMARHGAERSSQAKAATLGVVATGIIVGAKTKSAGKAVGIAAGSAALVQLGFLLPNSRSQESEADYIGTILAAKAGYDPRAAIRLWEKMSKAAGGKEMPEFLSTHPVNSQRIKDLEKMMPEAMQYYNVQKTNKPKNTNKSKKK